jgi:hypothetical protein
MKYLYYTILLTILIILIILHDENNENYYINKLNKLNNLNKLNKSNNNIKEGYMNAKNNSINICVLARDCGNSVINNKKIIEKIGKLFKKYKIILFENDSSDNTREIIKKWEKENKNVYLIRCKNNLDCIFKNKKGYDYGQGSKKRIQKMGYYREQYLDLLKKSDYEYTLIIDIDLDLNVLNLNQFAEVLSKHKIWDGVAINGRAVIPGTFGKITIPYDPVAYSKNKELKEIDGNLNYETLKRLIEQYNVYNTDNDLVKIGSAFNGICLYKTKVFKNSTYLNNGNILCEHLILHKNIDNFYIAPNWKMYQIKQGNGTMINQILELMKKRELFKHF